MGRIQNTKYKINKALIKKSRNSEDINWKIKLMQGIIRKECDRASTCDSDLKLKGVELR